MTRSRDAVTDGREGATAYVSADKNVEAGIQYFVVQLVDGSDRETIQLLADEVVPAIQR